MERNAYQFRILERPEDIKITHTLQTSGDIVHIHVHMESEESRVFPVITCTVNVPACGVREIWDPKIHLIKALNSDWFTYLKKTNGFTGAPVQSLIGMQNQNHASLGISDTLNTFDFQTVPVEETGEYAFTVKMFQEDRIERQTYDVILRLDLRTIPYYGVLKDMSLWWEKENYPLRVPAAAKETMYSTWYSYHQMIEEESLLKQCRISKELGCRSLLIDDGWQTEDSNRGYAYCGDWKPASSKIPDMAEFVRKVHELGMKVIPWYSLPFIGEKSENFERFRDMLIDPEADREWHVLDPRYPEVREFIISLFKNALKDWDVDGFKMDFIDEFVVTPFSGTAQDERRDFASFHEASDCMMKECIQRLTELKPEILLEFRQTYNGPKMRTYGNIFRAVDCPFDAAENHVRVTDIRLLSGSSAVHSDMIMWHPKDTAESAALQIINILFSVPQISMRLDELSKEHWLMLKFYCWLWKEYQEAFINGTFEPLNPVQHYNIIKGSANGRSVCTWHSNEVISMDILCGDMAFVNGSGEDKLYLDNHDVPGEYSKTVYNCLGETVSSESTVIENGINVYEVPVSGTIIFKRLTL